VRRRGRSKPVEPDDSARAVALAILEDILDRHRPLDAVIEGHAGLNALAARDRAFARLLVATTLRRLGQIDGILRSCLERPLPPRARAIQHLLRLGVCQLLFVGTPAHAAVDATVGLVAVRGGEAGYKGLVNAVLRRVDRERATLLAEPNDVAPNAPTWLWRSWVDAYGKRTARAIAEAHLAEPPLDLTVREDLDGWSERLGARVLPTGTLRLSGDGPIEALPGYGEGAWWVQDAGAALPARLLGDVAGLQVIDLCAAPGGKTAQLAAMGADVVAVDRSAVRLGRLAENLRRLRLGARAVAADAVQWRPESPADAVLLDAPCTSSGTLRRHPDVPWLKRPADLPRLADLQDQLLAAAVDDVKPGGFIVYCTCSLQPEEGPQRIAALIAGGAPVERIPIAPAEVGWRAEFISPEGDLRTLPCHWADLGGLDGFYAARLRRT
jgi:16S rRNA (cytosine967-C5)-methyltransferase